MERSFQSDVSLTGTTIRLAAIFVSKSALLGSLAKGFVVKAMKLFVTMSTLLTSSDFQRLGPYLWKHVRNENDSSSTTSVCFSFVQLKTLSHSLFDIGLFSHNAMCGKDPFRSAGRIGG